MSALEDCATIRRGLPLTLLVLCGKGVVERSREWRGVAGRAGLDRAGAGGVPAPQPLTLRLAPFTFEPDRAGPLSALGEELSR